MKTIKIANKETIKSIKAIKHREYTTCANIKELRKALGL
jgi:hypothetical protein